MYRFAFLALILSVISLYSLGQTAQQPEIPTLLFPMFIAMKLRYLGQEAMEMPD
jgi:uncharacterized membrane protein AbrB (regulator of aidB expression)